MTTKQKIIALILLVVVLSFSAGFFFGYIKGAEHQYHKDLDRTCKAVYQALQIQTRTPSMKIFDKMPP